MDSDIKAFCDKAWFHTCIRHYFPRYEGDYLTSGWLHRFMGISPPAGSLSAALRGSIIVPDGSHGETACHGLFYGRMDPLCTLFAVMDGWEKPELKTEMKKPRSAFPATGGLGASSNVASLVRGPIRNVVR